MCIYISLTILGFSMGRVGLSMARVGVLYPPGKGSGPSGFWTEGPRGPEASGSHLHIMISYVEM